MHMRVLWCGWATVMQNRWCLLLRLPWLPRVTLEGTPLLVVRTMRMMLYLTFPVERTAETAN